jgi:hypothetical protein
MRDAEDIVRQLLTMVGSLFEDASAVAIMPEDRPASACVEELARISADATTLLAAVVVVRRYGAP